MNHMGDDRSSIRIEITQSTGLVDERLGIVVRGNAPHQMLRISASQRDNHGQLWESWATFRGDSKGEIDLGRACPLTGTYQIADSMGLFWSMELQTSSSRTQPTPLAPLKCSLTAEPESGPSRSVEIIRAITGSGVTRHPVKGTSLVATLFKPTGIGPFPGVIVLGGSEGGLMEGRAAMLASHGFSALAVAYFGLGDLPKNLINVPVEIVSDAVAWMRMNAAVDPEQIGLFGTSKGGELALLAASRCPDIRRVVAVVPSGVVFRGIGPSTEGVSPSSWSIDGEPAPFARGLVPPHIQREIEERRSTGGPVAFCDWYHAQLSEPESLEQASIPVERINGPVLLISGGDDQMWPSSILCDMVMDRLRIHGHPFPDRHLDYPKAGHSLFPPYYPTTSRSGPFTLGGNPADDALAQADSWPRYWSF